MQTIKRIVNWMNRHLGGLRGPDAFFILDDPIDIHIAQFGIDEPNLNR